ncbi:TRAM domain-containing protein [Methanocaldococcus indicus]|uniref:TRAM domain-containing protein n=1 Tax=Methanocaldococcus indicus TaxID=213231 RepID=UPI003C6D5189
MFKNNKGSNRKFENRNIPVKEGETYSVTIEDIGKGGDGIARVEGFVVFVPETQKGDKVNVKIKSVKNKFAFGEKVEQ